MILKQKDDISRQLKALEALRGRADLSDEQRKEIEEELWTLKAGARGEREAAYHIDFQFGDAKWIAVIHDLRIEHKGRVAQIDHLILNRLLDIHIIESKNFSGEIQISSDGVWESKTQYGWRGMMSPVEQNRRHIAVLKEFIRDEGVAPRRIGLSLKPTFHNWVLVAPRCHLRKSGKNWENVVKMDLFIRQLEKQIDQTPSLSDVVSMTKIIATDTLFTFANSLVAAHKPASIDFHARPGIPETRSVREAARTHQARSAESCEACGDPLEPKVIAFCRYNSHRFRKKFLCRSCQQVSLTV